MAGDQLVHAQLIGCDDILLGLPRDGWSVSPSALDLSVLVVVWEQPSTLDATFAEEVEAPAEGGSSSSGSS